MIAWWFDLQLPVQLVSITTKAVSSNSTHGEVYQIHYVIKFVLDLRQVHGFFSGTPLSTTNKFDRHIITEILIKEALKVITLNQTPIVAMLFITCGLPAPREIN